MRYLQYSYGNSGRPTHMRSPAGVHHSICARPVHPGDALPDVQLGRACGQGGTAFQLSIRILHANGSRGGRGPPFVVSGPIIGNIRLCYVLYHNVLQCVALTNVSFFANTLTVLFSKCRAFAHLSPCNPFKIMCPHPCHLFF